MINVNDFDDYHAGPDDFIHLIDCLVKDIIHLESEIVRTRYELSRYLKYPYDELMRSDIFSNLSARYDSNPVYQLYINLLYDNQDPLASDEWLKHIQNLANGIVADD